MQVKLTIFTCVLSFSHREYSYFSVKVLGKLPFDILFSYTIVQSLCQLLHHTHTMVSLVTDLNVGQSVMPNMVCVCVAAFLIGKSTRNCL